MPNAAAHRLGAALVVGGISHHAEQQSGQATAKPLVHAAMAALCGTLPDILEPAFHPNHRQFFHSMGFAGILGYGLYSLHRWKPEPGDELGHILKTVGLIAGGSYLIHLAMDFITPKSLPLM